MQVNNPEKKHSTFRIRRKFEMKNLGKVHSGQKFLSTRMGHGLKVSLYVHEAHNITTHMEVVMAARYTANPVPVSGSSATKIVIVFR
jgi:hypothetical protein